MTRMSVWRWVASHPVLRDIALTCVVVAGGVAGELSGMRGQTDGALTTRDFVALAVVVVAVSTRRLRPALNLVGTAVAALAMVLVTGVLQPMLVVTLGVLTYTTTAATGRRSGVLLAAPIAVGLYVVDTFVDTSSPWSPRSFAVLAGIAAAAAAGDAVRSRRAYVAEVEERARRAEHTREEEAARRVAEERVRIARDLHDVVAHHIAVINVQAGAASHVLVRHPDQARRALTHIRDACGTVLSELASIVGVLRENNDHDREPVRGLAALTTMIDSLAATGLTVERRQAGEARDLPAVVDLAAYRILQEALTNAHKYGTGTACVTITYTDDSLILDVVNPIAVERAPVTSGYGILGMTERAATAGGTLDATARPDGRFAVHAELPAPTQKATT
ncbi:sensor histidine kinase [Lentzea albida]|uniref:histidine kinase n=1 Tax=Lentzea albida TaxID=65499 RepID=A0A1H9EQX2_9PSEU|nr:histidine kinase [Lentzea albida]SEQ28015.1 Signal transduction histidine kinase [Lentzea albida]